MATGIEHIDKTIAGAGDIVRSLRILQSVGHKNLTIEVADAEGRVARGKIRVGKTAGVNLLKTLIVGFHMAGMEIRHVEEIMTISNAQRGAFINGAVCPSVGAIVDGDNGMGTIK